MSTASNKCLTCPITGFEFFWNKKFIFSAITMVIWVNLFAWIWHGQIMQADYMASASLWRPVNEMIVPALNLGLSLQAIIASYIFIKGYEGRGWKEGLRFGILVTLLFLSIGLITYATQPMPVNIITMWTIGDLITYCFGGVILSKLACKF